MQEEIDEEALPCLTTHDLRSLGVSNKAHQQIILSAAVQARTASATQSSSSAASTTPAAQPLVAQGPRPSASHSARAISAPNGCPSAVGTASELAGDQAAEWGTGAALPLKTLPGGGLHSLASAVAHDQMRTVTAATAESAPANTTAQRGRIAATCQPAASNARKPGQPKANAKPAAVAAASKGAAPRSKGSACSASTAAEGGVKGPEMQQPGQKVGAGKAISTAGAVGSGKQAMTMAPCSKAEEQRHFELALSASLGQAAGQPKMPLICVAQNACVCTALHLCQKLALSCSFLDASI